MREAERPLSDSSFRCLRKMKKAVKASRKLLKTCHGGSKIYLALENEAIMEKFHDVYAKISVALDDMPYEQLGISNQMKQGRTNTQDMELVMDLMVLKSSTTTKNEDDASIESVAHKLGLQKPEELKRETALVKKLFKERKKKQHRHHHHHVSSEGMQQIAHLLDTFKRFAGLPTQEYEDEEDGDECSSVILKPASAHQKGLPIAIPNEFLCPITLEIMSDPVIISTGQVTIHDHM
ncbi:unnamed protein product [Cuscuta campestris]|uniref:U-box domain-containing protein n=1 Tax=Cuscuta campestris TaxID=132261 RepID=A0A484KBT7_9ASTE|nr:unnamed protein product [Cuscuta campestris]